MHFDPELLLVFPVFIFSVVVHECAHGLMALACGDPTARERGRLTLNPIAHADLVGSVLVPGALLLLRAPFLIGWAKPVPIDHSRLRDLRNDPVKVALAGPASNFLLAFLFAGLVRLAPEPASAGNTTWTAFFAPLGLMGVAGVVWNVALGLFNLLPIPPLDGSWVLMRFLRMRHIIALQHFRFVGLLVVAAVVASPLSKVVLHAPVRAVVGWYLGLFGVSSQGLGL